MDHVVGISEFAVSSDPGDRLITYSLGSCVGLVLHDPKAGLTGLLHAMLPLSSADPARAASSPASYVDTGTTILLQELFDHGARRGSIVAKIAGAAGSMGEDDYFRIGERNHTVLRRVLWKNGILIASEDVGGARSRTLTVDVGSGRVLVKSDGKVSEL